MQKRIYVAGHSGLVGSALVRRLEDNPDVYLLTAPSEALDLREQTKVMKWFAVARPEEVYVAAGTVGGILANSTRPAEFLYDNLLIATNIIHAAHWFGVRKLIYLGSSCIYPRAAGQPIGESALLTGPLEPTNEAYAIAKIAGLKLVEAYRRQYGCNFISAMPTNLYGPGDNYDTQGSHVIPALIRKFYQAKLEASPTVECWGSGRPLREFLHVDDLADALLFLMANYDGQQIVNVGSGEEISIGQLAHLVRSIVYPEGQITWDTTKPDGMPRKLLDTSYLRSMGWEPGIRLEEGLRQTYEEFLAGV